MNMSDYEQYYQKGGTYVLPIELFNELFGEMESWKEQAKKKESSWNSLFEYAKQQLEKAFDKVEQDTWEEVLDKMNELEKSDKE